MNALRPLTSVTSVLASLAFAGAAAQEPSEGVEFNISSFLVNYLIEATEGRVSLEGRNPSDEIHKFVCVFEAPSADNPDGDSIGWAKLKKPEGERIDGADPYYSLNSVDLAQRFNAHTASDGYQITPPAEIDTYTEFLHELQTKHYSIAMMALIHLPDVNKQLGNIANLGFDLPADLEWAFCEPKAM